MTSATAFATITSQGQVTLPAKLRRLVGLDKPGKVLVQTQDNQIVIKKASDFLDLAGSLHQYAIKGKTIDEIIAIEEEAWGNAVAEKYGVKKSS